MLENKTTRAESLHVVYEWGQETGSGVTEGGQDLEQVNRKMSAGWLLLRSVLTLKEAEQSKTD